MDTDIDGVMQLFAIRESLAVLTGLVERHPEGLSADWNLWEGLRNNLIDCEDLVRQLTRTAPLDAERLDEAYEHAVRSAAAWQLFVQTLEASPESVPEAVARLEHWKAAVGALLRQMVMTVQEVVVARVFQGPPGRGSE